MQIFDCGGATVAHASSQASQHLIDHLIEATFERHTCCNSLGHELLGISNIVLEVAVLRAFLHGFERTHATIGLKFAAIEDDGVARRFFNTGKHATQHDRISTCSQRLDDVARVTDTAISNQWNTCSLQSLSHIIDCRQLWNTDTSNDASRAD